MADRPEFVSPHAGPEDPRLYDSANDGALDAQMHEEAADG